MTPPGPRFLFRVLSVWGTVVLRLPLILFFVNYDKCKCTYYIEIEYCLITCLTNENNRLLLQVKLQRYSCVSLSDPNGSL